MTPKWISTLAVATVVSLLSVGSAAAEDRAPTRTVKTWDLDLAQPRDAQTLYERVHAAANDLCGDEARKHWLQTRAGAPLGWRERCVTSAVGAVIRDLDNPSLAALHARR